MISRLARLVGSSSSTVLPFAAFSSTALAAAFASVTRHLRRFVPLVIWALVFFTSLAMLLLAYASTHGRDGMVAALSPSLLIATAVYAFVASFQLPIRKRRYEGHEQLFEGS